MAQSFWNPQDWSGAESALRRALELNPNHAWGHINWSDCLLVLGRGQEAITEAQLLIELDPLWAGSYFKLGQMLCYRRDYDHSFKQLQKALELDPNFLWAHAFLAQIHAWKGRHEESLGACEKVANLLGGNPYSSALRGMILAMAGRTDEARTIMKELHTRPTLDTVAVMAMTDTYSILGEKDAAFALLESAYKERAGFLIFLRIRPTFDNIRSDQRFTDLQRRMGLPQVPLPTSSS